jgi:CheY-like chemotaxis protein
MPVMNGNVATAEIRKIENEFKYQKSFSSPTFTQSLTTSSPTTTTNDTSDFSSFFNKSTSIPTTPTTSDSNNYLKPNNQKSKFLHRRVSNPDSFQNNPFSIANLLPKIKLPKTSTKQKSSPLPSPEPISPSFTNTTTRSLIFALTGLASEEDKDLAFESGVDGFLTKPVSLKMLEKVLKKWSERNEISSENSSMESNNSSSGGSD